MGDFGQVQRRIIDPAVQELTGKDGWLIQWEAIEAGRKMKSVWFTFMRDPQGTAASMGLLAWSRHRHWRSLAMGKPSAFASRRAMAATRRNLTHGLKAAAKLQAMMPALRISQEDVVSEFKARRKAAKSWADKRLSWMRIARR
nr:replication initiation protein [Verminephrobacter eiseniae]